MYDVAVVGARCAGSPLAMLLARKGYRVLLVDKAHFPSDTVSTHLIWQAGLARARRWGLLDEIRGLGAPPIRGCRFEIAGIGVAGSPPPLDGIDYAVAPRRVRLDAMLLEAAEQAGAEVRQGFYVGGIEWENGRVSGIRGRGTRGGTVVESARIVVGADGAHSLVAHWVQARKYHVRPSTACAYYAYWHGGPRVEDFETYVGEGWGAAAFPTNDGLTCIVAAWNDAFPGSATDPEEGYRKALAEAPRLAEFLDTAGQTDHVTGIRDLPGFFRQGWGPGWALAGDAGYHKHPLSAQGVTDAFRDADLLAEAMDAWLSGRQEFTVALPAYQRQRDEAVLPMYASTCERALLARPTPEIASLFRALRHNQAEADRFFGTDAGTYPLAAFFAPQNLARIVSGAPTAAGGAAG